MTQKSVPILCAGCEATIVVTPDMLDGAYACEQCGAAIDFSLYEPLEAMIQERRAAVRIAKEMAEAEKKRARSKRIQAERAEAERVRAEHEAMRQREMERRAEQEAVRRHEEAERRAEEERKHPLGEPPPYSFLNAAALILRVIGAVICVISGVILIIAVGISLSRSGRSDGFAAFVVAIGPILAAFVIGIFYVAIGEGLTALRDIAIKVHLIAEKS